MVVLSFGSLTGFQAVQYLITVIIIILISVLRVQPEYPVVKKAERYHVLNLTSQLPPQDAMLKVPWNKVQLINSICQNVMIVYN